MIEGSLTCAFFPPYKKPFQHGFSYAEGLFAPVVLGVVQLLHVTDTPAFSVSCRRKLGMIASLDPVPGIFNYILGAVDHTPLPQLPVPQSVSPV